MKSRAPFRIDVHHHFTLTRGAGYSAAYLPTEPEMLPNGTWSADAHLAFMDAWGIEAAILSEPHVANYKMELHARRRLCRAINVFGNELVERRGDRFGAFATVPLPDVAGAVEEARFALAELRLDGVILGTSYQGRYLGEETFDPLYEELDRLGAVVFVHPTWVDCVSVAYGPGLHFPNEVFEAAFETTRAIASIVYAGVPRRFSNIRWIFAQGGGAVPFLASRFAGLHAHELRFNEILPEGPKTYLSQFFYESAQSFGRPQTACTRALASADHVLFGTDYPSLDRLYAEDNRDLVPGIGADLPTAGDPAPAFEEVFGEERIKVERTNALTLFPRLAARLGARLGKS